MRRHGAAAKKHKHLKKCELCFFGFQDQMDPYDEEQKLLKSSISRLLLLLARNIVVFMIVYLCARTTHIGDVYPFKEIPPTTVGVKNHHTFPDVDPQIVDAAATILKFCRNMYLYLES